MKKEKRKISFPDGFKWGVSTSAHQIEGDTHNQWSIWEKNNAERLARESHRKFPKWQQEKFPQMKDPQNYISGSSCDHWSRFEEDFEIIRRLNCNSYRFSVEWSRIESQEGEFDQMALEHYGKMVDSLLKKGIEPWVCLWHWTNPVWLEKKGGCASKKFIFYFERFAEKVVDQLGDKVRFWLTVNEPSAVTFYSYLAGSRPPQKKNPFLALKALKVMALAHERVYRLIHQKKPGLLVSHSDFLKFTEPYQKNSPLDKLVKKVVDYFDDLFMRLTAESKDFLAVQYYFHFKLKFPGLAKNENQRISDLGWEVYPKGIYHVLKGLQKHNLPIYVTENGLADQNDIQRESFIKDHLWWVHRAIKEGVDVRGYFHWSLLDNFEWDVGFWPRFGLVEVDFQTKKRKIRKSGWEYAKICKNNQLEIEK
jgi:beta-glucosidase